jgi:UDP-2,3-diacylglucosamine pyrophosphatase LpxH
MSKTIGAFISDIHLPDEIKLDAVFEYLMDLAQQAKEQRVRFTLILGGDILDAKGMHGIESLAASQIKLEWYERDKKLLTEFLTKIADNVGKNIDLIYLEGNHEERYSRVMKRYPDAFAGRFDFMRDVVKKIYPNAEWVPYGTYESYFKLGDTIFTHGTIYPENHAKKYATIYAPFKVVYGHLHHFQAFTLHNAMPELPAHYAVTAGCLTHLAPEWKKGHPNMWQNGFIDFVSINGNTTATPHPIDNKGRFQVGGKIYGDRP